MCGNVLVVEYDRRANFEKHSPHRPQQAETCSGIVIIYTLTF
jgi:hypothetical protein